VAGALAGGVLAVHSYKATRHPSLAAGGLIALFTGALGCLFVGLGGVVGMGLGVLLGSALYSVTRLSNSERPLTRSLSTCEK
jgi:protein-S-isoprenylcysteine O-methyltransferase Ste14